MSAPDFLTTWPQPLWWVCTLGGDLLEVDTSKPDAGGVWTKPLAWGNSTSTRFIPNGNHERAGGAYGPFNGLVGAELQEAIADVTMETALAMQSAVGDVQAIIGALRRGVDPYTGKAPKKATRFAELRIEAKQFIETALDYAASYEQEFGVAGGEQFVAHYAPQLPGLLATLDALPAEPPAGPLFAWGEP